MNVFTDFHHNSLLRSFVLLFENRLGAKVYRPIGMEWFHEGYWAINNQEDTAKQFLDINTTILPDNTPFLNSINNIENDCYYVYDPGHGSTHKAITLDIFKEKKFDFIIASIPQHVEIYKKLIDKYQPKAKLIIHIGNNWSKPEDGSNVLASIKDQGWQGLNVVYYHQEFDMDIFKPINNFGFNRISSYINVLQANKGWDDFINLEKILQDGNIQLSSYGGQCRDGNFAGPEALAKSMQENDFIFHVKYGGDGYGHVLYNAYACGKPTIIRSSYYKNSLGEELFNPNNCIDLDTMSVHEAAAKIKEIISDKNKLQMMSLSARESFVKAVDFRYDAEKIQKWLASL